MYATYSERLRIPKTLVPPDSPLLRSFEFLVKDQWLATWREEEDCISLPREGMTEEEVMSLGAEGIHYLEAHVGEAYTYQMTYPPRSETQEKAIRALWRGMSGLLVLACGKGKTYVSLAAAAAYSTPLLVVVHTVDILAQWVDAIAEHTNVPAEDVRVLRGAKRAWQGGRIVIATVQTLASIREELGEDFRSYFGIVVYDEAHHYGAPKFSQVADITYGLRWGLTATPDREDSLNALYRSHLGDVLYEDLEQSIIPDTYFYKWHYRPTEEDANAYCDIGGNFHIGMYCKWLATCADFQAVLRYHIREARNNGHVTMVVDNSPDHLRQLHEEFPESGLIIGEEKMGPRRVALQTQPLLFVQVGLAKEALDRPAISAIICSSPFTKKGTLQQLLGRAQRPLEGKDRVSVVFFDPIHIPEAHAMTYRLRSALKQWGYPHMDI